MQRARKRRLIVPVVLAVTVAGTVAGLVATSPGCGGDKPRLDASLHDAAPDTPVI